MTGSEIATFTVNLIVDNTVAAPLLITMSPIASTTALFDAAPLTVTTNVGLNFAPANPTTLPVSCTVTGGASWLSVATGNPTSLSSTAVPFNFTITPANVGVGNFTGGRITCTTTGGITPALSTTISVTLIVNGTLTTVPANGSTNALMTGAYNIGQATIPTKPLTIASSPTGATVTITSSATWLTTSTPTATAPATVQISILPTDPAIVPGASLSATITVSAPDSFLNCAAPAEVVAGGPFPAGTCSSVITYTLTVGGEPVLTSPASITFNVPTLAGTPQSQTVAVTESTTPLSNVPVTATTTVTTPVGGSWITSATGNTPANTIPFNSTVTVNTVALPVGQWAGAVDYTSPNATASPNTLVVVNVGALAVNGVVGPTAVPVNFFHQFGVTVPVTSTLTLSSGLATYGWVAATPVPSSGTANCNWLIAGAASGSTSGATSSVTIGYNPSVLNGVAGTYQCTIGYSPVASFGAAASDTVPVVVTLVATTNPVWVVNPNTSQTISSVLPSTATIPTTFQIAASSILAPATTITATVTPNASNPFATIGATTPTPVFTASATTLAVPAFPGSIGLTITANPAGLPQGTYQGNFTITSPSITTAAVVTVNLVVVPQCLFTLTPSGPVNLTNSVPNSGTPVTVPGSFTVTPNAGCTSSMTWTASSSYQGTPPVVSWLIITSGNTGNGGTVGSGTFNALSNPTSSGRTGTITITPSVGVASVLQVTQPGSTAPLLNRQVAALYQSVLGRDADPAGFTFWTGIGTAGLGQMLDSFSTSPEAFNTNVAVMSVWQAATGAPPTYDEFTSSVSSVRLGVQTIPGMFSTLSVANNSSYAAINLYMNLLNRANGAGDAACIATGLAQCFETIIGYQATAVPVGPGSNNEFQSTGTFANHVGSCTNGLCIVPNDHTNSLYIRMLYYTILGRDADQSGLTFWLGIANSGGAGLLFQGATGYATRIQIVGTGVAGQGFAGSAEFQSLYQ